MITPKDAAREQAERCAREGPLFIVMNEASGHRDATQTREQIKSILDAAGREHHFLLLEEGMTLADVATRAVRLAREQGGVVVAAGGDGTINGVAQAVLGSGCPFGVLPQGTFNYFGRTHGIPQDTEAATRALLGGRVEAAQAGLVEDRVFLVNASLGLYPTLLEDREAYKAQFGRSRWVAMLSGLRTLLSEHRQLHLSIELAGQTRELRTPTLFIGNNAVQLERLGFAEAAALERGALAAIAVRPIGTLAMFGLLVRGALGRLGEADQVMSLSFRRLSVRTRGLRRVKVGIDGEIFRLRSPLEFRVAPDPLWLLVPPPEERVEPA